MDDQRRIALVETKTVHDGAAAATPASGSATSSTTTWASRCSSWTRAAPIISYEEYHPYGTHGLPRDSASAEVSRERYRYTGKEKRRRDRPLLPRRPVLRAVARTVGQERPDRT